MSTVYLHVGQCGVQIGKEFWKEAVVKSANDIDVKHACFGFNHEPRCLFIDSERKVIQKFIEETKKSKILKELKIAENSIRCRKGCGSNWAMGYHGLAKHVIGDDLPRLNAGFGKFLVDLDSSMLEVCIEAIRTKVEKCDSFSGFLCLNSLAGGTGSGWGSRLCEELSDLYPTAYRLWNVITPCNAGETPTQHYNQLLSLAKLQERSDAIVLFSNDAMLDAASRLNDRNVGASLSDLNKVISKTLQSLYLPISSLTSSVGSLSIGIEPWEMIRSVAAMPSNKFLQTSYSELVVKESNPDVWDRMLKKGTTYLNGYRSHQDRCLSALCVCRGTELNSFPDVNKISPKIKTALHCVDWNPFPVDVWWEEPKRYSPGFSEKRFKSMTLCMNCSSIKKYLKAVYEKSQLMFDSGAYLHWYSRYGVGEEDFAESFEIFKTVIDDYDML